MMSMYVRRCKINMPRLSVSPTLCSSASRSRNPPGLPPLDDCTAEFYVWEIAVYFDASRSTRLSDTPGRSGS